MRLALALLAGGTFAALQERAEVERDALAAVATGNAELLHALAHELPQRVRPLVHELLWEALRAGAGDARALDAARALAGAFEAAGAGNDLCAAVGLVEGLDERARSAAHEFARAFAAGTDALRRGERESAVTHARAAVTQARVASVPYLELRARRLHAESLHQLGRHADARAEMLAVLELERALQLELERAGDLEVLSEAEAGEGRLHEALTHLEEAEALARVTGDPGRANLLLARRGGVLASLGLHADAHATLARALAASTDSSQRGRILVQLGALASGAGRYGEALACTLDATRAWRAAGDAAGEARAAIQLALVYSEMGLTPDAELALQRASSLCDAHALAPERVSALLARALIELDAGRFEPALASLERVSATTGSDFERAEAERHRGTACLALARPGAAEDAFRRALAAGSADGLPNLWCRTGLGDALLAQGRLDEAEREYEGALAAAAGVSSLEGRWRALYGLGRAQEARGTPGEALIHYQRALEEVEALRGVLAAPTLRRAWLGNKLELYRRTARLLARAGRIDEAFRTAEAAKARTLLELSSRRPEEERERATDSRTGARARADSAESRLHFLELSLWALPRTPDSAPARAELEGRRSEARAEHEAARLELELDDPRGAALLGLAAAPSLARARAALREDELLLHYLVGPEGASVFVVHARGARFVELEAGEAELAARIERVLRPIELLRTKRIDLANLGFDAAAARELEQLLLGPVAAELGACRTLWVVPDGPLRRLPFGLLVRAREKRAVDPERLFAHYEGCRFLVEDCALAQLPSTGLLDLVPAPLPAPALERLVVAAPRPLPAGLAELAHALEEARAVTGEQPGARVRLLAGTEASEERVAELLPSARIVHFATHGILDDERPAYSRLGLAPGGDQDGWLFAYEVEARALAAERVFLSACETLGGSGRGEGFLGLTRAFLRAGARSVVATSWAIDDEASCALVRHYEGALAAGEEPIAALRSAQVAVLRGDGRPGVSHVHPWFWAGFQHVGQR